MASLKGAIAAALLLAPACMQAADYAIGADVSFMRQAEQRGIAFSEAGKTQPALAILHAHGYAWIRLRLFHSPTELPNDLDYTIALAKDAKAAGMKFLLDYHYADGWADPQQQPIPRAWAGKSHEELTRAVFEYTRDTIAAFRAAGVLPDMVQIGNEVTHGMLWPDGKLPEQWDHFAALLYAGVNGVDAGRGNGVRPRIMIHIDRGADQPGTKQFLDKLNTYEIPFDVIGQSYYPWFHGSLNELRANLEFMAAAYQKDIIIVETAYNWRPTEYVGKPAPFPESPEGQRRFLDELNRVVMQTPNGRGKGIFWWEPAVTGPLGSRSYFDDQHRALPVLGVFDAYTRH
ncbi:MAG: glycosyl hydrolase 53 family protein [Steroidobacteraceae bacterium]|jgi:arabinogalactan endo-1,4-beta-galactosidase